MTTDLAVTEARYPSPSEVHALLLDYLRIGYANVGLAVNVAKDSDHWRRYKPVAELLSLAIANGQFGLRDLDFYNISGARLEALAAVFGITRRPASGSTGPAFADVTTGTVTITAGYTATAPNGLQYQVTNAAAGVGDGDIITLDAIDTGARTDLPAGTVLRWNSASIANLGATVTVAPGGLVGGAEADNDDTLRRRLLRRLAFPIGGGNPSQVISWAEDSSAGIGYAVNYPTLNGPGSHDVAIVGTDEDPELNTQVQDIATAAVVAEQPGFAALNLTSVTIERLDVVMDIDIPLPVSAGGSGGGWVDDAPWPSNADAVICQVTAVTATTLTVNSTSADPPTDGKRFAIWDPVGETFLLFTVTGAPAGSSGAYVITVATSEQSQLSSVVANVSYVSPQAVNLETYGQLFVAAMKELGPGEKTDDPDILRYARRKPGPDQDRPYAANTSLLADVQARGEVFDLTYAARYETGTTTTRTLPTVPPLTTDPPNILRPRYIAFRAVA